MPNNSPNAAVKIARRGGRSLRSFTAPVALGLFLAALLPDGARAADCEALPSNGARALIERADCLRAQGQAVRALDTLAAALDAASAEPGGDALRLAAYARLGQTLVSLGDYRTARDDLLAGVQLATSTGSLGDAAPLLNELGGVYMATGERLAGVAAFADSERLAGGASTLGVTAGVNLARALAETSGGVGLARLDGLRARTLALDAAPAKASALLALAELYREQGPDPAARDAHQARAFELANDALATSNALDDPRLESFAYGELGEWFAAHGREERALSMARQAALLAQAEGANDSLYRFEWLGAKVLKTLGRTDEALAAYRSAIATLAATQSALVTSDRSFRKDVLPLYAEYSDIVLASAPALSGDAKRAALLDVQATLEGLRLAEVLNYFENQCVVPELRDPRGDQAGNAVVIYPVLFADRAELLVSVNGELRQFTTHVALDELTSTVRALRDAIEDSASGTAYLEPARRLYGWLLEPLMPVIEAADPDVLVFVPDGPLRTIPLGALYDGERFLIERYAVATTPGLALIDAGAGPRVDRVLVNGLVSAVRGFPALPFVRDEIDHIAEVYPARVYADDAFLSATLEREIVEGGYSVVHLATHAQIESDYERSFLLTYDNVLTLDELESVMSSRRFTDRPIDLLVLSACQTAAGDDRAALGLAGMAVKAGARSALASLWLINDQSTARLMSEFYRELANGATSKAAALRGAQLLLLNDERYRHPAYWAPFLLIGDWR